MLFKNSTTDVDTRRVSSSMIHNLLDTSIISNNVKRKNEWPGQRMFQTSGQTALEVVGLKFRAPSIHKLLDIHSSENKRASRDAHMFVRSRARVDWVESSTHCVARIGPSTLGIFPLGHLPGQRSYTRSSSRYILPVIPIVARAKRHARHRGVQSDPKPHS